VRRRSTCRAWLPALGLAALATSTARAEPLYVIEQLVVSVSSAPDATGERIATLKSGDQVEVIERAGDQVHVRLVSGKDGWVRASYLSADEPLRVRLAQRDAEVAQLKAQVERLQSDMHARPPAAGPSATAAGSGTTAAGSGTTAAGSGAATPARAPAPVATSTSTGNAEDQIPPAGAMFPQAPETRPREVWPWTLAAALLGLAVGFATGLLVLDRYIRRKYGGLRIY